MFGPVHAGRHELASRPHFLSRPPRKKSHIVTIQQCFQSALQYHQSGRLAEAEALYRQILAVEPRQAEAFHQLGLIAAQMGRNDLAVDLIGRAVALNRAFPEACYNLGLALYHGGQLDASIDAYRQAIALKPDFSEAHANLGHALRDRGHLDEAIAACRRAITLRPDFPEAHNNLGNALKDQGQLGEAIAAFRQAITLRPDFPEAHSNLGIALKAHGQTDQAIAAYRQAIALKPDFPEGHCNLGIALLEKGQLHEAIAACRRAIALKPHLPEAHFNLALALLAQGDLLPGWQEFEWRWLVKDKGSPQRNFTPPQWDGGSLNGRTILLHAEQGFGDTLQFIRYAPLVTRRGGRVVVECQPELATLLAGVAGLAQIVTNGESLPAFDLHCPLMSLPLAFGTRLETIPADIPYLRADAHKAARWRERLARENSSPGEPEPLKVGLLWAGASRPHQPHANRIDRRRSMALRQFAPLAEVAGVVFVSLQKGGRAEQALTPPAGLRLLDWSAELQDFADTAALVECLDLVISVDTSVAHLAGALGKPVWMLNRSDTCWRWQLDRTDSPWYPTMRLFRQSQPGDWDTVIQRMALALQRFVSK